MTNLTEAQRKEVAKLYKGHTQVSLAHTFNCTVDTIRRWGKEGQKKDPNFKDAPRSGRPQAASPRQKQRIKQQAKRLRSVRKVQHTSAAKKFSFGTVLKIIKSGREPLEYLPVKHGRGLHEKNLELRVQFCRRQRRRRKRVLVYVDAKSICMWADKARHIRRAWQSAGSKVLYPSSEKVEHFQFYSAVAEGRRASLVFVPPTPGVGGAGATLNTATFIEAFRKIDAEMKASYPPGTPFEYVLDRARWHTSKAAVHALEAMGASVVHDFPPRAGTSM